MNAANSAELYAYNQDRYNLASPADIQPGMVPLVPDAAPWPENTVTSFGVAIGGSLYSQGKLYSMIPHEPCLYLSPEALALRDEVVARMDVPLRAAYNIGIPFPALIRDQSMQFAEFNFTAAEVVAGK